MTHSVHDDLMLDMVAVARGHGEDDLEVVFPCPICVTPMAIGSERVLTEFGDLGIKLHRLECAECGMQTDRAFHPAVGYKTISL